MGTTFVAVSDPKKIAALDMAGWLWTKNKNQHVYPYNTSRDSPYATRMTEAAYTEYWESCITLLHSLGHEYGYMEQD